jgi:DNA-binding LytR/AlgR family response regulator
MNKPVSCLIVDDQQASIDLLSDHILKIHRLLHDFEKRESQEKENFIFVESGNKMVRINFEEVVFLEALGNYVTIVFQERKLTVHTSLTYMHSLLPERIFVRVHKSFIASLRFIQAVSGNELLLPYNGVMKKLPIGQTYKQDLMKRLRIV